MMILGSAACQAVKSFGLHCVHFLGLLLSVLSGCPSVWVSLEREREREGG